MSDVGASSTPAITNLKITAAVGKLALSWGVSSTTNLQRILVKWRSAGSTAWNTEMLASGTKQLTISGTPGVKYEVEVLPLVSGTIAKATGTPLTEVVPSPPPPPPVVTVLTLTPTADDTDLVITGAPSGAKSKHVAYCKSQTDDASTQYETIISSVKEGKGESYIASGLTFLDAIALDASGTEITNWVGHGKRVQVKPTSAPVEPPPVEPPPVEPPPKKEPPVEPPPVEPPPATTGIIAVDTGGAPGPFASDISGAAKYVRLSANTSAGTISEYAEHGVKLATVLFGEGGSIQGLANEASALAKRAVSFCEAHQPVAVEPLNEPGGQWFWSDPQNYTAYVAILKAFSEAFKASGLPTLLTASWDGGHAEPSPTNSAFARGVIAAGGEAYFSHWVHHPYGGAGGSAGGNNGNRASIELAYSSTGKRGCVTELGWPQTGTGDSPSTSTAQQAADITSFAGAMSSLHLDMFVYFQYANYTGADYGIVTEQLVHKPAYAALAAAGGIAAGVEVERFEPARAITDAEWLVTKAHRTRRRVRDQWMRAHAA